MSKLAEVSKFGAALLHQSGSDGRALATARHCLPIGALGWYTPRAQSSPPLGKPWSNTLEERSEERKIT
jgi:hypothetical protein